MKIIKDFIFYLSEIDQLAKKLEPEKRKELETILRSMLILLVALRKSSHLGEISIDWLYNKDRDKSSDDFYS